MGTYTGTPRTWVAAETVTAALMNSEIRDPLAALSDVWTSYTPAISNFSLGNGSTSGSYLRFGKFVCFWASFTFGSTSAAATGACGISLPVNAARTSINNLYAMIADASPVNEYLAFPRLASVGVVGVYAQGTTGVRTNLSTTSPFTWTTSDTVHVAGTYEAA